MSSPDCTNRVCGRMEFNFTVSAIAVKLYYKNILAELLFIPEKRIIPRWHRMTHRMKWTSMDAINCNFWAAPVVGEVLNCSRKEGTTFHINS